MNFARAFAGEIFDDRQGANEAAIIYVSCLLQTLLLTGRHVTILQINPTLFFHP